MISNYLVATDSQGYSQESISFSRPFHSYNTIQVNPHDSIDTKSHKLVQINQNLEYNISLLEAELVTIKNSQKQKGDQNRKIKEKLKNKLEKEQQLKKRIKIEKARTRKLFDGLKLIIEEANNAANKEAITRQSRLTYQDEKNQIYESYNQIEKQYKEKLFEIQETQQIVSAIQQAYQINDDLNTQIQEVEQCLNQEKQTREQADAMRKQRANKIKQLNQRMIALQRQQSQIKSQINKLQQFKTQMEGQRYKLEEKSSEASDLYRKINEAKNTLISKKTEFTQVDSTYKQFCLQQNRLRKQILLKNECDEQRRLYKESLKSSKGENIGRSPRKSTIQQLQSSKVSNLLKMYENIKNRN